MNKPSINQVESILVTQDRDGNFVSDCGVPFVIPAPLYDYLYRTLGATNEEIRAACIAGVAKLVAEKVKEQCQNSTKEVK